MSGVKLGNTTLFVTAADIRLALKQLGRPGDKAEADVMVVARAVADWLDSGQDIEAAAHARGVAEERARWVLLTTEVLEDLYSARGYIGDYFWDKWFADDYVRYRQALAAMAPSSPQDDRGGPEGSAGV